MIELKKLVEIIASSGAISDISKFDPNKTFRENGADSLDVMNMFLEVEERLGVKFSDEESNAIDSLSDMVNTLNSR